MVFGDQGALEQIYDKTHLVPFGEYLPMQHLLESIGLQQLTQVARRLRHGAVPRPLMSIAGLPPVGALICYEAIFPAAIVQGADRPGLLINVTNDGWFGDTTGPWQHFHQTRVRAVEEGLPIVRAANNGVSAVVDANGRVVAMLSLNARGIMDSEIPASYRRHRLRYTRRLYFCRSCTHLPCGRICALAAARAIRDNLVVVLEERKGHKATPESTGKFARPCPGGWTAVYMQSERAISTT